MTDFRFLWYGFARLQTPLTHNTEKEVPMRIRANQSNRLKTAAGILLAACLVLAGSGAGARELAPEIASKIWIDNGSQVAALTINGEEILRFENQEDEDEAAEEAEDLAVKLQEILSDKRVDPEKLLPTRTEDKSGIKHDGVTILQFDAFAGDCDDKDKKRQEKLFDASLKVVNALRVALGATMLPANLPDMAEGRNIADMQGSFSGHASWYGGKFNGRRCSDGSRFSEAKMTAAHRTLPFGTKLLVRNRRTGDSCVVEVTDRGPFIDGRVIDLSKAAAAQLRMISSGVSMVDCLVINN